MMSPSSGRIPTQIGGHGDLLDPVGMGKLRADSRQRLRHPYTVHVHATFSGEKGRYEGGHEYQAKKHPA
jgi:hypothetical protein